jgi:predicted dehydrogenase
VTRFAFVGCGRVVEAFHLPALLKLDDVRLTACVDADLGRARALAEAAGVPDARIASVVGDIEGVCDAALVALPNYLHADTCVALLAAGCDVLVEKPMATAVADCDRMIDAARRSDRVFGVAMVRRFIPAYQFVHRLVASRTFGAVRRVVVREGVAYNWPATTGFFLKRREAGGGVLVDFGSHVFDALSWWLGPLTVLGYEDDAFGGVEAECQAHLSDARGVLIDVELTRLRHIPCTARIEWDRATIEIDLRSGAADLTIDGASQVLRGQVGVEESAAWTPGANPFDLQLRAFVADVRERAGLRPTALIARDVARLFEACMGVRHPLTGPASPALEPVSAGSV